MTPEETRVWNEQVQGYRNRINLIQIPANIEPGQAKDILSRLDTLYSEVRIIFGDIMKQSKEVERLIYRIENKNKTGSNESARRYNAVIAAENAERGNGQTVNLYDLETDINSKKEDIEAIIDVIEKKNSMVITMNGLLKVESNMAGH